MALLSPPVLRYIFRVHRLLSPLLLFLLAAATSPLHAAPGFSAEDTRFQQIADEYITGYLAWRPQAGTALGLHQYDGKVTDFGKASVALELDRLKSFDQRLVALPTNDLSSAAFYDYRILQAAIRREIFSFERLHAFDRNPMTYAGALDVNVYIKRNFAPLEQRLRSIVSVLKAAPGMFAAARANLAPVLPRPQVEIAIDEADGAADFLAKDLVAAAKPVTEQPLKTDFDTANRQAIAELRAFSAWLKKQKLPQADNSYALGRENFSLLLRYGEMVSLSPEQILEIGMRELRRTQEVFADAARQIDPGRKPVEVFQQIQREHPTPQGLIPDTARDLENIRQFLVHRHIITLPSPVRAQVKETPQYLRSTSFASMDTPGPFETRATEAYYYVTPPEPDWPPAQQDQWLTAFNYYTTDIVSIHEAYPGHYVQFLCLNASPATRLEKIFTSYAFTEGWAHYTEQMMVDQGFGAVDGGAPAADPHRVSKYRMAQADEALLRLCRLCVSIRMHCQGMTVEEGTQFFHDNCYYEQKPARQEALRGAYDPEYLYYTLGKLQFLKLREDYRKQEGSAFSLERFHDEVLRHGAPPLRLLREVLLKDRALWDQVL